MIENQTGVYDSIDYAMIADVIIENHRTVYTLQ